MPIQRPFGLSRRTLVVFLILYLISIGTSILFLSHYVDISHSQRSKGISAPAPGKQVSPQKKQSAIVYFYNEGMEVNRGDGFLMLYTVSTGQQVILLQLAGEYIHYAQISPDGQWVLFIVSERSIKEPYQLHMIRITGQQHEILYTFPPADYTYSVLKAQWSLDQTSVLLSTEIDYTISTLSLLNMKTRTVPTALQITSISYNYSVMKWLDRTHVFVLASKRLGRDTLPTLLYLLDITAKQVRDAKDLKLIVSGTKGAYLHFDTSPDGKRLYVAQEVAGNLTLWVQPATGGERQILFESTSFSIYNIRIFTHYLLMTVYFGNWQHEIWQMPLDAASHKVLFSSTDYTVYTLNRMTQYVSSDVSSDETMLAFETYNTDQDGISKLFVTPLPKVNATQFGIFPLGARTAFIVGWTTI